MAAEGSTAGASVRSGGAGASADSYIGSVISLTSKSEIRYEGILYNINTEESSIGLRNVRSFGTEGRNKDGPQVPPSNKIYEYILFRGSDIKDLQVKASPSVQTTPPINNDPAIIQSHYPRPPAPTASIPAAAAAASLPDHVSLSSQMGRPGSNFQNNLHLYQPGGNLNSWGHSLPNPNGSGLAMPMYWQGFYGTPNGLPQQSLLRPPPGMSVPPSMQQIQFSAPFNSTLPTASSSLLSSTLPDYQSSLVSNSMSSSSLTPSTSLTSPALSLIVPSVQPMSLVSEILSNPLQNKAPAVSASGISTSTSSSSLPSLAQLPSSIPDNALLQSVASKPSLIPGSSAMAQQSISQPGLSTFSQASGSVLTEKQTLPLVTPGQLLQSAAPVVSAPQTPQTVQKDVEVVQVSSKPLPEALVPVAKEAQPPILPLPENTRAQKHNGGVYHMRNNYRGRGGRGYGISRPVAKFTEDFDFTAMNEKFNKDEVWGHLGKSNRSQSNDKEENESDEEDVSQIEDDTELPKIEIKPVYNKDDFFDSLSCNSLESYPNNGRTRYSEQMKLDTETFGEFSRYRGRGGRGPGRGGSRFRGSYQGRGYGGYGGRGRGRGMHGRSY